MSVVCYSKSTYTCVINFTWHFPSSLIHKFPSYLPLNLDYKAVTFVTKLFFFVSFQWISLWLKYDVCRKKSHRLNQYSSVFTFRRIFPQPNFGQRCSRGFSRVWRSCLWTAHCSSALTMGSSGYFVNMSHDQLRQWTHYAAVLTCIGYCVNFCHDY